MNEPKLTALTALLVNPLRRTIRDRRRHGRHRLTRTHTGWEGHHLDELTALPHIRNNT